MAYISRSQKSSLKFKFLFLIFYLSIQLKNIECNTCKTDNKLSNTDCFNNIIIFNSKPYRAGNFAQNKNGDMIIEYSDENPSKSRLFYGLKKNGKYFFSNESPIKEIEEIRGDKNIFSRYESINIFVSLEKDIDKNYQYLLSVSSYTSLTELHDLNSGDYKVKSTSDFFGNKIFSYEYQILEVKSENKNIYFCIYIYGTTCGDFECGYNFIIKKFVFTSFDLSPLNETTSKSVDISNNGNNRIISSFIINEDEKFVVFFNKNDLKYALNFYDYNLETYGTNKEISNSISNQDSGTGIFFKSTYLVNHLGAFIYFMDGNDGKSLFFKILNLTLGTSSEYTIESKIEKSINSYSFDTSITLNDFLKMNNERLIFISTLSFTTLYILIFDLYNNYNNMKIRVYNIELTNYKTVKEFSAFIYNDYFLAFTSTVVSPPSSSSPYFSIFLMFGYANGTDSEIDLSPYFMDLENYDPNNNIVYKLIEGISISNNIFGYEIMNQIKLISIPNQIIFYNGNETTSLTNNSILDSNYKLNQNDELLKTDELYYLDYQFIIKEPNYSTFYSNASEVIDYNSDDLSGYFEPKTFYGRTNTANFKLCHKYCGTCKTLGISDNDQKCYSCLENYQYDIFNDFPSNCVPKDFFKDREQNDTLIQCNKTNSKFYFNATSNKTICFKKDYYCPNEYPYLNTSTNECQNLTLPTTIPSTIPITIPITIPTTIPITIPTTISTTIPITIPTTIPITISTTIPITIPTTVLTTIPTTIPKIIPPTTFYSKCSYNNLLNDKCDLEDYNNTELYDKIKSEIIKSYPPNGQSIVIEGEENYVFQITTTGNEEDTLNGNKTNNYSLSMIDLGKCETLLKQTNNISDEVNLIILKFEKLTNTASEKNVQYEVYDPVTLKQLNLSICEETSIDLYIPITLSNKTQSLYDSLKESGYDLFNENDPFYTDICTPYESENGTDVLLSDRKNNFYNNSEITCQANCKYSAYSTNSKYLKCECSVNSTQEIDTKKPEKFTGKTIFTSFYSVLKYSNYKVLKCFKLVFNLEYILKNIGSILTFIYFLIYLIFFIIFLFKGITPLKIVISNIFINQENRLNTDNIDQVLERQNNEVNVVKKRNKNKRSLKNIKKKSTIKTKKGNSSLKNTKSIEGTTKSLFKFQKIKSKKDPKTMSFPPKKKIIQKQIQI